jgi:eukaryotic translation initiation factor 2C
MKYIMDGSSGAAASDGSIVNLLRNDPTAKAFGLSNISKDPIAVSAILLPQAKLRYGGGAVVDPMLSGTWNMEGKKFINPPAGFGNIPYGILIVGGNHAPGEFEMGKTQDFQRNLEKDASLTGIKLTSLGGILACRNNRNDIQTNLSRMRAARIVVCVLMEDCYGDVKLVADLMGLVTQCAKFKKLERVPQGYTLNIMLKINTKLGGTNHTLISRLSRVPAGSAPVFQDPPASIAWIFDKPTMLVGIDVSHGETSSSQESVAAVVASMDGRAGQYAAHISVQTARQEMVSSLETAMTSLLSTFRTKNGGKMPSTIIVYRDGVGEGQFDQVTTTELSAIRGAVELMGFTPETVKISIVICQKGHHTRFVYEEMQAGEKTPTFINPCPGLCIDAAGGENSIASARLNEFYLNSHAAIQGTAKPCKYTLVHDEVGFKICELELLTYWLTYVYCRANKSVSYCSPAYYAHWASKRGKYLVAAGGTAADLLEISRVWGQGNMSSSMFFV